MASEGARGPRGLDGGLLNALLAFLVLHGQGGLVVQDILGARLWPRGRAGAGAAAGGQKVGRLQDRFRVLPGLHAQGCHASRAIALTAIGGEEGEAHVVRDTAGAQGAT